ncbi:MAG TPA: hypothetical protein VKE70_25925 [Candidatus Solibacter sp.]|nr:hypothetical protein [Candidatus Solibacter sp.]
MTNLPSNCFGLPAHLHELTVRSPQSSDNHPQSQLAMAARAFLAKRIGHTEK